MSSEKQVVYCVSCDYDDCEALVAVFSDLDKAEEYVRNESHHLLKIQEWEVK